MSTSILKTNALTMKFGGLTAVDKFSLDLKTTDLVGVIGGKSRVSENRHGEKEGYKIQFYRIRILYFF